MITLFGNLPFSNGSNTSEVLDPPRQPQNISLSMHYIQPLEGPHSDPISKVYSSFRDLARQTLADGGSDCRVLGSRDLDAGVILGIADPQSTSMLSTWVGQVVSSYGMQSMASKLGLMNLMFKLMRVR